MQLPQHTGNPAPVQQPGATTSVALEGAGLGSRPAVRSLYIHVPFCVHKCHYCDFYSFVDTRDQQGAFVDRLVSELRALAPHAAGAPLKTLFVGGGTPSLLRMDLWERLLGTLDQCFDLSLIRRSAPADRHGLAEFTVECNPESATPELLALLRSSGVNRVSLGAQSFNSRHLMTLERRHDPDNVARAIEAAAAAGIQRRSVDLIFAIPGQTLDEWDADLATALRLGIEHLSCYSLTYEPNTAMTQRLRLGEFEPVPDEVEAEMFRHTLARVRAAGFERYEVSNFSHPGRASRHNLAYWLQDQWLAAGPSASGHAWAGQTMRAGSHRWKNLPRLGDYLAGGTGFAPAVDVEAPDPLRLIRERIMMGLRLEVGLDAAALLADLEAIAPAAARRLRSTVGRFADRGAIRVIGDDASWRLTDEGFLIADRVAAELMATVRDG